MRLGIYPDRGTDGSGAGEVTNMLVKSCKRLALLLENLRGFKDLQQVFGSRSTDSRMTATELFRDALGSAVRERDRPMGVIRWRDIFLRLERAVDATEAAAHIVEGIVIEKLVELTTSSLARSA